MNENTYIYKIYDSYGISDQTKLAQLGEMSQEKNKVAYLTKFPMNDYIKKSNLLCIDKKDVFLRKDENGLSRSNLNELNRMSDHHVDSLFRGIWNNYIIPLGKKVIEYGDNKTSLFEEKCKRIEKEKL